MSRRDWIDIVQDKKPAALKKMVSYCKRDVLKLEQVYKRIAPYCKPKAHAGIVSYNVKQSCPRCASMQRRLHGFAHRLGGSYQRFQCTACYTVYTSTKKEP